MLKNKNKFEYLEAMREKLCSIFTENCSSRCLEKSITTTVRTLADTGNELCKLYIMKYLF